MTDPLSQLQSQDLYGNPSSTHALGKAAKTAYEAARAQIAGLVARRIVSFTQEGAVLDRGERFGLIRFGSRLDIYLPEGVEPLVMIGQTRSIVASSSISKPRISGLWPSAAKGAMSAPCAVQCCAVLCSALL